MLLEHTRHFRIIFLPPDLHATRRSCAESWEMARGNGRLIVHCHCHSILLANLNHIFERLCLTDFSEAQQSPLEHVRME
jgi:hypothetical protein